MTRRPKPRWRGYLIVSLASVTIAGCGGSSASSSSSHATTTGSATSTVAASPSSSITSATATASATSATTGSASSTAAPNSSPSATARRDRDVHVPAAFTLGPGGALNPPQIAVPKNVDIELTVVSRNGTADRLDVKTLPREYPITVPARSRTVAFLQGIRPGSYAIEVDHRIRGHLIVGVAPGP